MGQENTVSEARERKNRKENIIVIAKLISQKHCAIVPYQLVQ